MPISWYHCTLPPQIFVRTSLRYMKLLIESCCNPLYTAAGIIDVQLLVASTKYRLCRCSSSTQLLSLLTGQYAKRFHPHYIANFSCTNSYPDISMNLLILNRVKKYEYDSNQTQIAVKIDTKPHLHALAGLAVQKCCVSKQWGLHSTKPYCTIASLS
jgi:hypothetical protein